MKLPYYPGCSLKTSAKGFESSALASAEVLGLELVELPRWNCCGTVYSLAADDLMHHIAPARVFIRVQEMNQNGLVDNERRLVTLCSMCFNTLKRTNIRLKENAEDLEKINSLAYLEQDYEGNVEVVHFLELLKEIGFDKVKEKTVKPLEGLKVAPYYDCMLMRPKESGIDDPENPLIYNMLLEALGAEVVENPYRSVCCGNYQTVSNKEMVVDLTYDIISHARDAGAEAMITSCPLCMFNLDDRQKEVTEKYADFEQMPVLYFTQLMACAFGLNENVCGFELNRVNPLPLLKQKNIL